MFLKYLNTASQSLYHDLYWLNSTQRQRHNFKNVFLKQFFLGKQELQTLRFVPNTRDTSIWYSSLMFSEFYSFDLKDHHRPLLSFTEEKKSMVYKQRKKVWGTIQVKLFFESPPTHGWEASELCWCLNMLTTRKVLFNSYMTEERYLNSWYVHTLSMYLCSLSFLFLNFRA